MMITSLSVQSTSIHTAVSKLRHEFKWNVDRQLFSFILYRYQPCSSFRIDFRHALFYRSLIFSKSYKVSISQTNKIPLTNLNILSTSFLNFHKPNKFIIVWFSWSPTHLLASHPCSGKIVLCNLAFDKLSTYQLLFYQCNAQQNFLFFFMIPVCIRNVIILNS